MKETGKVLEDYGADPIGVTITPVTKYLKCPTECDTGISTLSMILVLIL